jgi:trehalose 6-phosphate phosphatase
MTILASAKHPRSQVTNHDGLQQADPLSDTSAITSLLTQASRLWLFLDYDGTLADFAPTPEHVEPDGALVDLITRLAQNPRIRIAVVSGRRLGHVQKLVPVPGIWLAGTYGIEMQTPEGRRIDRLDYDALRPTLDALKRQWAALLVGHNGFFLEDKGLALALHARFASEEEAERLLATARRVASEAAERASPGLFRLLGGHKFLEIGPTLANKGRAVGYLLDHDPWPGALAIYLGDDDKDEEAFGIIKERGGIAILVAPETRETGADYRLESPQAARRWLETLLN